MSEHKTTDDDAPGHAAIPGFTSHWFQPDRRVPPDEVWMAPIRAVFRDGETAWEPTRRIKIKPEV